MKSLPDIVLVYPKSFPEELIEKEKSFFNSDDVNFLIVKEDPKAYMSFEWVMGTVCAIYIFKSYFNGFFTEAGKDHYHILKNALTKNVEKGKYIKAGFSAAPQSTEKLSKSYNQSVAVSLILETKDNRLIKLLFDDDLSLSEWENGIKELLQLVIENHNIFPEDKLSRIISDLEMYNSRELYAIINPENKKIEICDTNALIKKYK